jgi:chromosome partitioning protein
MNLASILAVTGRRTVVLDADPQQSSTRWAAAHQGDTGIEVFSLDARRAIDCVARDLENIATETGVELVVLDCPPELRAAAEVALLLADLALIPVTPSPLDIWAAQAAVALAREAQQVRGNGEPKIALVPNRLIRGTLMARELPDTLACLGESVAPAITERVIIAESAIIGETILEYAPESSAHGEFLALSRFVMSQLDAQS